MFSGQFLTDTNGSSTPEISLAQNLPAGDATQLWSLTAAGGGYVIKNKATRLVFDDSHQNPNGGPYIILHPTNGGANQSWKIQ